ncbi:MAG: hypothetical protein ACTSW1_02120 [Candidatus Hodarchaeales archaeon]
MASKALIIGIPILLIGLLLFGLFGLIGLSFYPFTGTTGVQSFSANISAFSSSDISIIQDVPGHPFFVTIKVAVMLDSPSPTDCTISLKYESRDGAISALIPGTEKDYTIDSYTPVSVSTVISPSFAGPGFNILLTVENKGTNTITITQSLVNLQFMLFSHLIPLLLALIGTIITVVGFIKGKKGVTTKKVKEVPAGWEPTLQWGSTSAKKAAGSTSGKKPKLAIKSTKTKKTKTVVKRTVAPSGGKSTCKFCGKQVPANAFFCPHCYAKLK